MGEEKGEGDSINKTPQPYLLPQGAKEQNNVGQGFNLALSS